MKKIIILILFGAIFVIYFLLSNKCSNKLAKNYFIDNKNYCLLTATNNREWEQGLMFYKKPVNFDGMIFIFPTKQIQNFWNQNTYLDLDLVWMDGSNVVGKSYLPSIIKTKAPITVSSPSEVNRVVELIR